MNNARVNDLLLDLAKLVRKYGPEPFESLARAISEPRTAKEFSDLLAGIALAARSVPRTKKREDARGTTGGVRGLLDSIRSSDPAKSKILSAFHEGFAGGQFLPTLEDVRKFAGEWHLNIGAIDSRQKALPHLLRALALFPADEISEKIRHATQIQGDRGLEGWSRLILDRDRRPK